MTKVFTTMSRRNMLAAAACLATTGAAERAEFRTERDTKWARLADQLHWANPAHGRTVVDLARRAGMDPGELQGVRFMDPAGVLGAGELPILFFGPLNQRTARWCVSPQGCTRATG